MVSYPTTIIEAKPSKRLPHASSSTLELLVEEND